MSAKSFHLGWFMNFTPGEWDHPLGAGGSPWSGEFYVDMAKALERACFDYIMIEDTLMVSEAYGGTAEITMKHALQEPKHDPSPLAAIIAAATRHLGVVATFSTLAYPPFMLARLCATLDHIAGGRFGWTSSRQARTRRRRTSAWTSCRPASSATRWPTNMSTWSANCSTPGTRMRW
jgi:alkanesulfonate monooxygenase SsuD/methylene tetrahydromethanopterin reductase-like flavin-dependent oxidoreductase (luciferase family)